MTADEPPDSQSFKYNSTTPGEPTLTIIGAISQVRGESPTELEPIQSAVDCDRLNALFNGENDASYCFSFRFDGCEITVRADEVRVKAV